jgi:hypothetical protein
MAPQAHPPEKGVLIVVIYFFSFRSFNDATNEWVTSGQPFFAFDAVADEGVSVACLVPVFKLIRCPQVPEKEATVLPRQAHPFGHINLPAQREY